MVKELTPNAHVKEVVLAAGDLVTLISGSINGFSFAEVATVIKLLTDLQKVVQDFPVVMSEYKGLDDAARADLFDYIQSQIQFPQNTDVEKIIEKVLEAGVALSVVFTLLKK